MSDTIIRTNNGALVALLSKSSIAEIDFSYLPYHHPEIPTLDEQKETTKLAKQKLGEFINGNPQSVATGIEVEGTLYDKKGNLLPVHDNISVTFNDIPPERYTAQLEVVTNQIEDGRYPSSATEIAQSLALAVYKGYQAATRRNGQLVFASVPEGGEVSQLTLTKHPKIQKAYERGQTYIHPATPEVAKKICQTTGITNIVPFSATHVHVSNPLLPNGLYDARAAYAAGILELTQLSQVLSFMLFSTKDYFGKRYNNIRDVRSLVRRTTQGAHDACIPQNAYDCITEAIQAIKYGTLHDFSRFPITGQHDRVRLFKDFGTTEAVSGAANPDLRLILAYAYCKQLLRALSYHVLCQTGGDESQVIPYLQKNYGYLFTILPTMHGENSCLQQDIAFNKYGFAAQMYGRTYRQQIQDIRLLIAQLGQVFPAFGTQAKIVNHILGKVITSPDYISLSHYLDRESPMHGGIVSDYKSENILDNISAQAEGTKKQTKQLLRVRDTQDLLHFFGLRSQRLFDYVPQPVFS